MSHLFTHVLVTRLSCRSGCQRLTWPGCAGPGVVWVYVTDILMSVASNYIIAKLPTVWVDVRARISSQEVRSRHAARACPSHTDLCAPRLFTQKAITVATTVAAVTATTAGLAAVAVAVAAGATGAVVSAPAPTGNVTVPCVRYCPLKARVDRPDAGPSCPLATATAAPPAGPPSPRWRLRVPRFD